MGRGRKCEILNKGVRENLTEKVATKQSLKGSEGMSHEAMQGKSVPGRGKSVQRPWGSSRAGI